MAIKKSNVVPFKAPAKVEEPIKKRTLYIIIWDSYTGECSTLEIKLFTEFTANNVHNIICAETGEEPEDYKILHTIKYILNNDSNDSEVMFVSMSSEADGGNILSTYTIVAYPDDEKDEGD